VVGHASTVITSEVGRALVERGLAREIVQIGGVIHFVVIKEIVFPFSDQGFVCRSN